MKLYINGNTGFGKTTFLVFLTRLYSYLHPNNQIYGNLHLQNIPNFNYSEFMFLPFSKIKKGNCLLLFDDFKASGKIFNNYSTILGILSRKVKVSIIFTVQYYTHLTKEMRELCHYEVRPKIIGFREINQKFEKNSKLELDFIFPHNTELDIIEFQTFIPNIFYFVNESYFNTNELPKFINDYTVIQEITKISNNFDDIYNNVNLYTSNRSLAKKLRKQICVEKEIPFLY